MQSINKTSLNAPQQQLIELMQRIYFGRIVHLRVIDGHPAFTADTRIERDIKFTGESSTRPPNTTGDFTLKQEVWALLAHLAALGDGLIRQLEIKHGLPFLMRIEERAA